MSRQITGAQIGLLLGWMSTRVLGQYDQLLIEDEHPEEQDIVYYVGPNVLAVERRYGFPAREFRLWLALHEVTHRAQFTGVPWMRDHFLGLVERTLAGVDPDPKVFLAALRRSVEEIRAGRNPLDEGGLLTLIAGPEQHAAIQEIGGLMSLLEGHGDITMDRAGADRIPSAAWFSQVLKERRRQRGLAKVVSVLVGLDAKMQQYEQGERFIEAVEQAGGPDLLAKVWDGPQWLPTWSEIRAPAGWIARDRGRASDRDRPGGRVGFRLAGLMAGGALRARSRRPTTPGRATGCSPMSAGRTAGRPGRGSALRSDLAGATSRAIRSRTRAPPGWRRPGLP